MASGTTFEDLDGDGIQDIDEPGIPGVNVILMDCNGTTIATTTTDPDGNYSFGNLLLGNYQIRFDISTNTNNIDNYRPSLAGQGTNPALDSDINPNTSTTDCLPFDPANGVDIDAGFSQPTGTVVGVTFEDVMRMALKM